MISRLQLLALRPVAAIVLTVITLAVAGGIILTSTSMGCGPAQKLGLKGVSSHCKSSPVAVVTRTPTPPPPPSPAYSAAPYSPPASSPYTPPSSPPYYPPASGPQPPYQGPATGSYPPFVPPATGGGPPPYTLNCRLPVYNGPPGSGGFIVYPGGTYISDPTSSVVVPSPSPGSPSPQPGEGGPSYSGLSYDFAYHRWLPVPFTQVSPDGSRYAHVTTDAIYVESVANGSSTELGHGHLWQIVSVENNGVYAEISNQPGLWLLPFTGAATQVAASGFWQMESHGAAYGTSASAVPQGVPVTILRLDVTTHSISDWFSRDGASSNVFGVDANGNPIIYVNYYSGGNEVWLVTGPNSGTPLFGSPEFISAYSTPAGDGHGIWFSLNYNGGGGPNGSGLALYVPGSGLYWMSSLGTQLAGGCN